MSWRYKDHVDAKFGVDNERLDEIPERVTRMTFDRWQIFYNGDPEHWEVCENSNFNSGAHPYRLPAYKINRYQSEKYHKWEYRYVKFLSADDYRKYNIFINDMIANGEDYENLKEIAEFAEIIGKISAQRLKEVQERTQKAIDDNARLMKETRLRMAKEDEKRQIILDEQGRFVWS